MNNVSSNRCYEISYTEVTSNTTSMDTAHFTLDEIFYDVDEDIKRYKKSDGELMYAIRENIDSVLDLKLNETMYFQPNRDDKTTKGIILRTK